VRLKIDRDITERSKVLVLPKVTDLNLAGLETKISKGELGALGNACTVDNNKGICTISKRAHPSFDKFLNRLSGQAHIQALQSLFLRIPSPLLVVTTVARPRLDDRALIVPDIHAQIVHAADNGLVVDIIPLLVQRLLTVGLVTDVAREYAKLDVALITVGDLKAETIGIADGIVTVEVPDLVLIASAWFSNDISIDVAKAMSNLTTLNTELILVDSNDFLVH